MSTAVKTERITILGTSQFKAFLKGDIHTKLTMPN